MAPSAVRSDNPLPRARGRNKDRELSHVAYGTRKEEANADEKGQGQGPLRLPKAAKKAGAGDLLKPAFCPHPHSRGPFSSKLSRRRQPLSAPNLVIMRARLEAGTLVRIYGLDAQLQAFFLIRTGILKSDSLASVAGGTDR